MHKRQSHTDGVNLILMEFHGDGYLLRKKQFQLKNETHRNINEAQ